MTRPGHLELTVAYTRQQAHARSPGRFQVSGCLIRHADPVVWITPELIRILHDPGPPVPVAVYSCAGTASCPAGDLIRIRDLTGRQVVYLITGPAGHGQDLLYEARWPD